ncbi:MAG: DUF523 and DUF1722 domain-containing protein [Planctomycetota bacterium]
MEAQRPNRQDEIRIGISGCLLGQNVRFDGGHKRDHYIDETLRPFVKFVPVCPEVEIGMGTPRESIRLDRVDGEIRLRGPRSGEDYTEKMSSYAEKKSIALRTEGLSGFVLKRGSPSCGLYRVRVYDHNGVPSKSGRGVFAEALARSNPALPVEEEGRLNDPRIRDNFFEQVFAYRRLQSFFRGEWRVGDLVRFHTGEKLLLMAHDPRAYKGLGRIVAGAKGRLPEDIESEYTQEFMRVLKTGSTTKKHSNVLLHVLGHFRKRLAQVDRQEILDLIEDFRKGLVPLVLPVTFLRHHIRQQEIRYLSSQSYLEPHPKELMLRNYV